jgi:hypothetical protein
MEEFHRHTRGDRRLIVAWLKSMPDAWRPVMRRTASLYFNFKDLVLLPRARKSGRYP